MRRMLILLVLPAFLAITAGAQEFTTVVVDDAQDAQPPHDTISIALARDGSNVVARFTMADATRSPNADDDIHFPITFNDTIHALGVRADGAPRDGDQFDACAWQEEAATCQISLETMGLAAGDIRTETGGQTFATTMGIRATQDMAPSRADDPAGTIQPRYGDDYTIPALGSTDRRQLNGSQPNRRQPQRSRMQARNSPSRRTMRLPSHPKIRHFPYGLARALALVRRR